MRTKKLNRHSRNGAGEPATPRHLLVPVDFSDASLRSCDHAARLAAEWGAALTLVHVVVRDDGWLQIGRDELRDLDQSLQAQAAHELRTIATHLPRQVQAEFRVRIGRPAEEIVAVASEIKAELIILSTHGRTGLDRYFIGSVAERVMRLALCPVYLMPVGKSSLTAEQTRSAYLEAKGER